MMHTIVDLNEVFAEPERQNTEEKLDEHIKSAMAFDVMRTMLSNGK